MANKKYDWILGSMCTDYNGVGIWIVKNRTIAEMKRYLVDCVKEAKINGGTWDSGTLKPGEVEENKDSAGELVSLYAEANFYDYHCDYEAHIMDKISIEE